MCPKNSFEKFDDIIIPIEKILALSLEADLLNKLRNILYPN